MALSDEDKAMLDKKFNDILVIVNKNTSNIKTIENKITKMEADIKTVNDKITKMEADIKTVNDKITKLESDTKKSFHSMWLEGCGK